MGIKRQKPAVLDPWEQAGEKWADPAFRKEFMDAVAVAVRQKLVDELEAELNQEALSLRKKGGRDGVSTNVYLLGLKRAIAVLRGE